ncbi:unnamed protein product [Mytilus coruscus]|uniref:Uncharacterized protein n=1 Tax=Mytilus coruscus TaxID=42192 RepID=A0A6J8DE13_MYTCO|nr:unnamed protein product [Mytilus coruscus]
MNTELDPKTIYPGTTIAQMSDVDKVLDGNTSSNEQKRDGFRSDLQDLSDRTSDELTPKDKQKVRSLLIEIQELFASSDVDLGRTNLVKHEINTGNARPFKEPPRRTPYHLNKVVNDNIDIMLQKGIIEPSPQSLGGRETVSTETEDQYDTVNAITRFGNSNDKDDDNEHHDLSLKEIQKNDHDLEIVTEWVETDGRPDYKDISDQGFFIRSLGINGTT